MDNDSPGKSSSNRNRTGEAQARIPIHNILRHLALEPTDGQSLFPGTWNRLRAKGPLEISTQLAPVTNASYELQHQAHAVFDSNRKIWLVEGQNDKINYQILGIVVSKQNGARAIQLPNRTNKIVAGVVDTNQLLNLFSEPIPGAAKKLTINLKSSASIPFISLVTKQGENVALKSPVKGSERKQQPAEYILHSKKKSSGEQIQVRRENLAWADDRTGTVIHQGSDMTDLAKFKDILFALRNDLDGNRKIQVSGSERENLQKRLRLLQKEIDGLERRKISYTSKQTDGSRFLDYTTILSEKENQIIVLSKKIQNYELKQQTSRQKFVAIAKENQRLVHVLETLENPSVTKEQIKILILSQADTVKLNKQHQKMRERVEASSKLMKGHLEQLKSKGVTVKNQEQLQKLANQKAQIDVIWQQGVTKILDKKQKIIEVPLEDQKTRQLIRQMGLELQKIYSKYPKVKNQSDPLFVQLINKEVVTTVENDGLSKITDIVRVMPSVVRVQNVYQYNHEQQRKKEFHMRVLLKALLEEFETIKKKTGVTAQIDEGVIHMIHQQIGDGVQVDKILKTFQVNQKIVEVPKIVQKIVERVIEVPTVVPIQKVVQKVIQNTKIEQVEKIVHVPFEVIKYVDRIQQKIVQVQKIKEKIIQVPKIIQKIVQKRVQVPKIVQVQVLREKIVQVEKPVVVQKIVNQPSTQIKEVEVLKQETVVVNQVVQVIKEVQVIVQKIVQRIVQKPVLVQIQKVVQKISNTVEYKQAKEIVNHIERVPQTVDRIIQKKIPIIQTVQKIKEVPKIIQKIVQVRVQVPVVKQIKALQEKIVYQEKIIQVQKIVEKIVPIIKEVIKEVQRKVQVPIIQQKIVKVTEIVQKIVPYKSEQARIVEVEKVVERIVEVPKIVQVQKPVVKYITQEKPIKVQVQKIVPVPKIVQKIKQVRVPIDKIIEKMVEVPKVVQVQKLVEKIVVIPRVIQKIVQVPQIVQKIVDRIVEVEKIIEVVREVKVPIIEERVVEIQVIKNVQVPVYKQIQKIVEKIVPAVTQQEVIKEIQVLKEKIVENRVQVPKEIVVEKIVPQSVEIQKIIEVLKVQKIPYQKSVPSDKIVQKLIVVEKQVEKVKYVEKHIETIVEVVKEVVKVEQVKSVEEKIVFQQKIKEVEKQVPYVTQKIKEIQVIRDNPILKTSIQEKILEVPTIQQKIVQVVKQTPKICEVLKVVQKAVEVPKYLQITSKDPVIISNNKIIQKIVQKAVQVRLKQQQIVEVPTTKEKIVEVHNLIQKIKEVPVSKDVIIEKDRIIQKTNVNNKIQTKYEPVQRFEQKIVTVNSFNDRIVEVPHVMEKVVEKIMLMPQVHQVTRHIYDIQEKHAPGVVVDKSVRQQQAQYQRLYGGLKKDKDQLLKQLRVLKKSRPELSDKIDSLEKYMISLDNTMSHARIVEVTKEKTVEKQVSVPVYLSRDSEAGKNQAYYLILIEKLTNQLKNAQEQSYNIKDDQLKKTFFSVEKKDQDTKLRETARRLAQVRQDGDRQIDVKGQAKLLQSALRDKLIYANQVQKQKLQAEKYSKLSEERLTQMHEYKQSNDLMRQKFGQLEKQVQVLIVNNGKNDTNQDKLNDILRRIEEIHDVLSKDIKTIRLNQPSRNISAAELQSDSGFLKQKIRQLQAESKLLKEGYKKDDGRVDKRAVEDKDRIIANLTSQITNLVEKGKQNPKTQSTLGVTQTNIKNVTSMDLIPDNTQRQPVAGGYRSFDQTPSKLRHASWSQYPIFYEEDHVSKPKQLGYLIVPDGESNLDTSPKGYRLVQLRDRSKTHQHKPESFILVPIGTDVPKMSIVSQGNEGSRQFDGQKPGAMKKKELDPNAYPYGRTWLPYSPEQQDARKGGRDGLPVQYQPQNNGQAQTKRKASGDLNGSGDSKSSGKKQGQNQRGRAVSETEKAPTSPRDKGPSTVRQPEFKGDVAAYPYGNNWLPFPQVQPVDSNGKAEGQQLNQSGRKPLRLPSEQQMAPFRQQSGQKASVPEGSGEANYPFGNQWLPYTGEQGQVQQGNSGRLPSGHLQPGKGVNKSQEQRGRSQSGSSGNRIGVQDRPEGNQNQGDINYPYGNQWLPYTGKQGQNPEGKRFRAPGARNQPQQFQSGRGRPQGDNLSTGNEDNARAFPQGVARPRTTSTPHSVPLYQATQSSRKGQKRAVQPFNPQNPHQLIPPSELLNPTTVRNLPGETNRVVYVDPETGARVESFQQTGEFGGQDANTGSYLATYMYRSQKNTTGEGVKKVQKTVTEIRTNQRVQWVSNEREPSPLPRKEEKRDSYSVEKQSKP